MDLERLSKETLVAMVKDFIEATPCVAPADHSYRGAAIMPRTFTLIQRETLVSFIKDKIHFRDDHNLAIKQAEHIMRILK